MNIVLHIGAHVTDGERLLHSLRKNADALAQDGVRVPAHGAYRPALREAMQAVNNGAPIEGQRELLLERVLGADAGACRRLVLSNPAFICTPSRIFEGREFYALVGMKAQAAQAIFAGDDLQIFLATRNPATFVPAVFTQAKAKNLPDYLSGLDPTEIRWSDVVRRLRAAVPQAKVTVWANEDTPLIWGRILRRMAGLTFPAPILGEHDLLASIMSDEGLKRLLAYLRSHPPQTGAQMSRVVAAFLDKYALPEEIEEEIDVEGWDAATVAAVTEGYEADLAEIARIEDVEMLAP
ncbi:hypothetical protein [Wenxinia marina]|uniref:Uncharacterized protein n=1 Tax=Wenxinia marina DSM 24838 TaxID=1123501 RepID=A0A0D0QCV7_9RHOB|nr:hypothetical protein [Wenxinia marina]KIQ68808.1 hypothetical protein Wenmar_02536 [Wenxinia marina DSM 24838]GGL65087.1 hypothetical protein GCM10011392_19640 [Wenxinia marina]